LQRGLSSSASRGTASSIPRLRARFYNSATCVAASGKSAGQSSLIVARWSSWLRIAARMSMRRAPQRQAHSNERFARV
jgi:hypothetical protein